MLHAGLDLSRKRLDYCLLDECGERVEVGAAPPDGDGLRGFARRVERGMGPSMVRAAIESMNGARFVHDTLERCGWEVEVADAQKVKGLAPLACKTDQIDAWVLAELSRRDLVPAIWLPGFAQRQSGSGPAGGCFWSASAARSSIGSMRSCWRSGTPARSRTCSASRSRAAGAARVPRAVARRRDRRRGDDRRSRPPDRRDRTRAARLGADHRYVPLLMTVPGIAWVLGYTIAAEIGDISRFASPRNCAATADCARVSTSPGGSDRRGQLTHAGPSYLRWALIEAAVHAGTARAYRDRYHATKRRLGRQRGARVAQVDIARRSPRRSGTCSPATSRSLGQAPPCPLAAPTALTEMRYRSGSNTTWSSRPARSRRR